MYLARRECGRQFHVTPTVKKRFTENSKFIDHLFLNFLLNFFMMMNKMNNIDCSFRTKQVRSALLNPFIRRHCRKVQYPQLVSILRRPNNWECFLFRRRSSNQVQFALEGNQIAFFDPKQNRTDAIKFETCRLLNKFIELHLWRCNSRNDDPMDIDEEDSHPEPPVSRKRRASSSSPSCPSAPPVKRPCRVLNATGEALESHIWSNVSKSFACTSFAKA